MTHLLDTNVFIAVMRGQAAVLQRLRATNPADIGISSVSLYELYSGVERCAMPLIEKQKVEKLIQPIHLLPFDADAAQFTVKVRRQLEVAGNMIGPYDFMLAGQALSLGVTFVTHNTGEFSRVQGLLLEDWQ
jgi:tRNA(fMet)-specific endonuclease VapC